MKSKTQWISGYKSILSDDRGHEYIVDLPTGANGEDMGTTALELCAMTFGGCVSTIFAMVAKKMRLTFSEMEVDVDAVKAEGTIAEVSYVFTIKTDEDKDKIIKCLEMTEQTCPIGILFRKASVVIKNEIVFK